MGDEVEEGLLVCGGCARTFPVINGIPRLLPDELAHLVVGFHAGFFRRFAGPMTSYLERCRTRSQKEWWRVERGTVKSYSYQWRKFKEMIPQWKEVFGRSIAPIEPSFFQGKLGLDAGCGFGRSLYYAASYGAEVIGMDLSEAVEVARENTRHLPNVHVIQADIFHPPLQERSLDFVYSIGVLHHLPDPKRGFLALTRLLAPGAPIFIWVYSRGRGRQIALFTLIRAVSTRLPLRLLDFLCLGLAAGQWALWIAPYRLLSRFQPTRGLAQRLPFTFYAQYPFRVLHADWFDGLSVPLVNYYRCEEITEWFREAELERVRIDPDWGGRALGYVPSSVDSAVVR
jgi:SAM-dependent methyltransferase